MLEVPHTIAGRLELALYVSGGESWQNTGWRAVMAVQTAFVLFLVLILLFHCSEGGFLASVRVAMHLASHKCLGSRTPGGRRL